MNLFRAKLKAFGIHLLISALIFLPFLYLILYHWYPMPFFLTDGGWQGVRIMLAIDMVIGPTLTLLVYDPRKSRAAMTFDYSFISLVQAAALTWGCINVESQRPIVISVYEGDYKAIIRERLALQDAAGHPFEAFSPHAPPRAYVETPSPGDNREEAASLGMRKGLAFAEMVMLMRPYQDNLERIKSNPVDLDLLKTSLPEIADEVAALRKRLSAEDSGTTFHLVDGRFERALIGVDSKGEIRDWLVLPQTQGRSGAPSGKQFSSSGGST